MPLRGDSIMSSCCEAIPREKINDPACVQHSQLKALAKQCATSASMLQLQGSHSAQSCTCGEGVVTPPGSAETPHVAAHNRSVLFDGAGSIPVFSWQASDLRLNEDGLQSSLSNRQSSVKDSQPVADVQNNGVGQGYCGEAPGNNSSARRRMTGPFSV